MTKTVQMARYALAALSLMSIVAGLLYWIILTDFEALDSEPYVVSAAMIVLGCAVLLALAVSRRGRR